MNSKPMIALPADTRVLEPHAYHLVGDKYIQAVAKAALGIPVMLPALVDTDNAEALLKQVDGIVLTGAYSNIEPHHYGESNNEENSVRDPHRDSANLALIPLAIDLQVPIFGICRGFQEMNVALGGTLYQKVHEVEGMMYHLEDKSLTLDEQYGPSHEVTLRKNGFLASLSNSPVEKVNSLHGQAVNRLADKLTVEATAPDGLVEAFTVDEAQQFALAVQWHPEWKFEETPFYMAIWRAFGEACRERREERVASG